MSFSTDIRRRRLVGVGLLIAAATLTGVSTILVKQAYALGAGPIEAQAARFLPLGLLAGAVGWVVSRRRGLATPRRELGFAALAGVVLWVNSRFEYEGLALLPSALLVVLLFTGPVWAATLERALFGKRITTAKALGVATTLTGVVLLAAPGGANANAIGVLFGCAAAAGFAIAILVMQRAQAGIRPLTCACVAMAVAACLTLIMDPSAPTSVLTAASVGYLLAAGVAFVASFFLAMVGLSMTDAVTTTSVQAIEVPVTALLAWAFLFEDLSPSDMIGTLLVITGTVLVARDFPRRAPSV